jgi:hypothetical protein
MGRKRKLRCFLMGAGLAGVAIALSSLPRGAVVEAIYATARLQSPEVARVNETVRDALIADEQLGIEPSLLGSGSGKLTSPRPLAEGPNKAPQGKTYSKAQAANARRRGEAAIKKHFPHATPSLLAREHLGLDNILKVAVDPNQRILGQGVSEFRVDSTTISGDEATVSGQATIWSQFEDTQTGDSWGGSTPSSVMDFQAKLAKVSGQWTVTDYTMRFPDGTGP